MFYHVYKSPIGQSMGQATPESMWEETSQGMDARSHDSWGVINVTTDDKDVVWRKLIPDAYWSRKFLLKTHCNNN